MTKMALVSEAAVSDSVNTVVVLGMGGTIAGLSPTAGDRQYQAAQVPVAALASGLPLPAGWRLETEQVAQVDSKDMAWPAWRQLLQAVARHQARPHVKALLITHGTDTLEETALLLHLLLPPRCPVVLTAAMRPANAPDADGPGNLRDALAAAVWAAQTPDAPSAAVMVCMNGQVWSALSARKAHSWAVDAFDGGGDAAVATITGGHVSRGGGMLPPMPGWWADDAPLPQALPRVALLTAHADADDSLIRSLLQAHRDGTACRGLVLAGTGHGTLPESWQASLRLAHARGITIWRTTRVARGGVSDERASAVSPWPATQQLTPAQARLALSLALCFRPEVLTRPSFGF